MFSRADALYRYVRSTGTRFGFLPEVIGRKGDVVACETCALMDFMGVRLSLSIVLVGYLYLMFFGFRGWKVGQKPEHLVD